MERTPSDKLREICRRLQGRFRLKKPVRLVVRKMGPDGGCTDGRREYCITIRSDLPYTTQCDTLVHEFAHALVFDEGGDHEHTDRWGILYARVYRAYLQEWIESDNTNEFLRFK